MFVNVGEFKPDPVIRLQLRGDSTGWHPSVQADQRHITGCHQQDQHRRRTLKNG